MDWLVSESLENFPSNKSMQFKSVSVIGLGYIGLPTAAMFAKSKVRVIGVDINQKTIDSINSGRIHFVEPGLEEIVADAVKDGFLKATKTTKSADAFLIAVPTPFKINELDVPEPDLSFIKAAADKIAPILKSGDLVVLESTSPVGTTEQLSEWLSKAREDLSFPQQKGDSADISIAYCPERVIPGQVVYELVENDRIIGGMSGASSKKAADLYKIFVKGQCIQTSVRTAEMAKLTENSCRDVQIAFANELSVICDNLNINVWELINLSNKHPRVNILQPGPGVGGHCIAVDPWFIVSKTPKLARLIRTAREVNDAKPRWVVNKVKMLIAEFLQEHPDRTTKNITIACYGLSFKPDIDDLRESPAMEISACLSEFHSGEVIAVEPNIDESQFLGEKLKLVDLEYAIETADLHLLLVDHKQFRALQNIPSKYLIDTKGIWSDQY